MDWIAWNFVRVTIHDKKGEKHKQTSSSWRPSSLLKFSRPSASSDWPLWVVAAKLSLVLRVVTARLSLVCNVVVYSASRGQLDSLCYISSAIRGKLESVLEHEVVGKEDPAADRREIMRWTGQVSANLHSP